MAINVPAVSSKAWTTICEVEDGDVQLTLRLRGKGIHLRSDDRKAFEGSLYGAIAEFVMDGLLRLDLVEIVPIAVRGTRRTPAPTVSVERTIDR